MKLTKQKVWNQTAFALLGLSAGVTASSMTVSRGANVKHRDSVQFHNKEGEKEGSRHAAREKNQQDSDRRMLERLEKAGSPNGWEQSSDNLQTEEVTGVADELHRLMRQESMRKLKEIEEHGKPDITLPSKVHWLKEGRLDKKIVCGVVFWAKRRSILTRDSIYFMHIQSSNCGNEANDIHSDVVLDYIPLHEIESVYKDTGTAITSQFTITTMPLGHNLGRKYAYRARSKDELMEWYETILSSVKNAKASHDKEEFRRLYGSNLLDRSRQKALELYNNTTFQSMVALVICSSFMVIPLLLAPTLAFSRKFSHHQG